ncbi:MAG: glycogen/starch synthase [bacterium]
MANCYNIFYLASDVSPFAKTGGLADVTSALPREAKDAGYEIRVFMSGFFTL